MEAITALVAVGVLVIVSFWLVSRLEHRRRQEFMRARVASAHGRRHARWRSQGSASRRSTARASRRCSSTRRCKLFAEGLGLWVALGAAAAAVALGGVAYAILKLGKQLPLRPMLIGGAAVLLLLAVAFTGNAVRSLQSVDLVRATPVDWPRLPVFVAELTGIHPTREGLIAQVVLLGVFVLGAVWVFAVEPARRRRRQSQRGACMTVLRVGVDVGGTFTKAVAVSAHPVELRAQAVVPTSHHEPHRRRARRRGGARRAVRRARRRARRRAARRLLHDAGDERAARGRRRARRGDRDRRGARAAARAQADPHRSGQARARARSLHTEHEFLDATRGLDEGAVDAALDRLKAAGCPAVAVSGAFAVDSPEQERARGRARPRARPARRARATS